MVENATLSPLTVVNVQGSVRHSYELAADSVLVGVSRRQGDSIRSRYVEIGYGKETLSLATWFHEAAKDRKAPALQDYRGAMIP